MHTILLLTACQVVSFLYYLAAYLSDQWSKMLSALVGNRHLPFTKPYLAALSSRGNQCYLMDRILL